MSVYQINYDLRNQRNYQSLYDQIKVYSSWCRPLESCWIISTNQSASQVGEHLRAVMDADDGLLVTKLQGEATWYGLDKQVSSYLKDMLERKAA